ncbi:PAS domain-containing protein [Leptolyngbya ohadii]|uniref:PAS domain-containing protein n=1 Tax=Leptolyngbya ohadii TaxID=1962290 RepID=UPI000B59905B|nr:PAS domain-containing protein [Leptolyngbya ohadii]
MNFGWRFPPYGIAVGSTMIALLLSLLLQSAIAYTLGVFFYLAIATTAWYGGLRPAIVAIVLSGLGMQYFFISPIYSLQAANLDHFLRLLLFVTVSLVITLLCVKLKESQQKLEQLNRKILEESTDRLNLALEAAQMGMWHWDVLTNEVQWSQRHERLFGLAFHRFDGQYESFLSFVHPDDRAGVEQALAQAIRHRLPYQHEFRVIWADGSIHWLEDRGQAFYNEAGEVVRMSGTVILIDQRKQAEEAFRQSEARLRLAQVSSNSAIWDWDIRTNTVFWSPEYYQLYGIDSKVQSSYDSWLQHIHPDDRDRAHQQTLQALADKVSELRIEFRLGCTDKVRWFADIGQIWYDTENQPIRVIGIAIDITQQKQTQIALQELNAKLEQRVAERTAELTALNDRLRVAYQEQARTQSALCESEERLRLALDLTHTGFWDYHLPTEKFIWNDNHFRLLGLEPGSCEASYELWASCVHPDDLPHVEQQFSTSLKHGSDFRVEYRVIYPDSSIHWIMARSRATYDPAGQPVRSIGVLLDITDRKQAEQELALQAVITCNMAGGVCLVKADDGTIVYANPKFEQMFGYAPDELKGQPISIVNCASASMTAEAVMQTICQDIRQNGEATYEVQNVRKDGTLFWSRATGSVFRHPDYGDVVVAVQQDITDRKQAEAALRQQTLLEGLRWNITQAIRQSLDLRAILNTTVEQMRQTLQVDRVVVYRFRADWQGDFVAESVDEGWLKVIDANGQVDTNLKEALQNNPLQRTQGGRFRDQEMFIVADVEAAGLSSEQTQLFEALQAKACAIAPIFTRTTLWGLLVVYQNKTARNWQFWELELLQQITSQLAIAIHQSDLYEQVQILNTGLEQQVQERTAQLQQALEFEALLKRITDRVRDSLDEGQILQSAVDELAQGLQVCACDTGIYNADHTTSTIAYEAVKTMNPAQGKTVEITTDTQNETAVHPQIYSYLLKGQICQFCDISHQTLRSDQRCMSILTVPMVDDQGVLGDLWLFKQSGEIFNDQEVRLVQQVANQCAIALRQSRLYQAAQVQVQELERLNQLKDDFLSTVSHELRTPMSNIKMATEMLDINLTHLGVFEDESNTIRRYFDVLQEEGQREINLINNLLDLTRLEAETEPLGLAEVNVELYISHLAEVFIDRIQQQQQELILQISADLPPLKIYTPYLERIVMELLNNACKYTPSGETITLSAQCLSAGGQSAEGQARILEICISNSGVAIPAAECDRIFEKFYRIPSNDPWKHGGTGLGLALVRRMLKQLGGTIEASSRTQPSCMTLFTIRLPIEG